MTDYWNYAIYTALLAIILKAAVTKKEIKKLTIYGLIFGGFFDLTLILVVSKLFGIGGHINYGPFGFKGIAFLPPLAWSMWFILFFHFIPENNFLKYIFIFLAAGYAVFFSNVLINLKIFEWNYGKVVAPFIIYFSWFSIATWGKNYIQDKFKEK